MGGNFQHETYETLEQLLKFIAQQVIIANEAGLYLLQGEIKQKTFPKQGFEWTAYFSK